MSNHVYNYVICGDDAKKRLFSLTIEDLILLNGYYDEMVFPINNDRFLIIFDTRGMEYRTEYISKFITEYTDTKWYCIEENETEQGFYYWNGSSITFRKRTLATEDDWQEIRIRYADLEYRPLRMIFISNKQIIFENILRNDMKKYSFSENASFRFNELIKSLMNPSAVENVSYCSLPFMGEIRREISIVHGNRSILMTEAYLDTDAEDGENFFDKMISSLDSLFVIEKIDESAAFSLRDEI